MEKRTDQFLKCVCVLWKAIKKKKKKFSAGKHCSVHSSHSYICDLAFDPLPKPGTSILIRCM